MRHYIPSSLEAYYESIIYEPESSFDYHNDIIASIYDNSYQQSKQEHSNEVDNREIEQTQTQFTVGNNSACGNLSRTIYSYNEIVNSLDVILKREINELQHHEKMVEKFKAMLNGSNEVYHNMTEDDFENYQRYLNNLKKSYSMWYNKTTSALQDRQHSVISKFINELYEILQHGDVSEFRKYMNTLHMNAENDVRKRNSVTKKPTEETNLKEIKEGFHKLLFKSDNTSLEEKLTQIQKIKSNLELAQTFYKLCEIG